MFLSSCVGNKQKCWNDINFEKIETQLLNSKVKEKVPFYEYYKRQELSIGRLEQDIITEYFYKSRKRKHKKRPLYVLFFDNGLKAIFKKQTKHKSHNYSKMLSVYKLSRFLNLKIVPPTIIREIDKESGIVQLFIENTKKDHKKKSAILNSLKPAQKADWYSFLFLTGLQDIGRHNLLISKICLKPFVADIDSMWLSLIEYGKPEIYALKRNSRNPFPNLSQRDYKQAPFSKVIYFNDPSIEAIKKTFSGIKESRIETIKDHIEENDFISYMTYKGNYWISLNNHLIYKDLLPLSQKPNFIKKIKALDKEQLVKVLEGEIKKDQNIINGILYRRQVLLKELEKL